MLTEFAPDLPPNLHAARADAGRKGATSRWGGRGSSKTVRVDADAAALATVPERDLRRVASEGKWRHVEEQPKTVRLLVTIQVLDADPGVVVQCVPESPSRAEKET